jgi:signal transduction histidine kinase
VHSVSYASLQPGHYRFEVRTWGWNSMPGIPATFDFVIHPPFWKTWWFFSICALSLSLLLYALYHYRIRQLMKLHQVRNRIATDLHDDIGSTLTNINILSALSYKNLQEPLIAEKFLTRITEEVTASSQALDDIIWSVNSRNDSLDETLARMRRYAAELFESSNTAYHLVLDENIQNKKLSMEQRRDIFLLFKESLNNVYKHADASHVWIKVAVEKNQLIMQVRDNGKGFDTLATTHRNGWKNMQARVEKWKGILQVQSEKEKGTTVSIQLPV